MVFRPEVYLSATPVELDMYRDIARKTLREMGVRIVENLDYTVPYGPLQGVLYQLISRCELVIQITGRKFGLEPAERMLGAPRRSFSHFEVDVARACGKPIFALLTAEQTKVAPLPAEDDEKQMMQRDHRAALQSGADIALEFEDGDDLARKLRELRSRIIVRRELLRVPVQPLGDGFIGRQQVMEQVRVALQKPGLVVLQPTQDHAADTGTGRTALAIELGAKLHEEGVFPYVFTLPGGPKAEFEVALASLARSDGLGLLPDEVGGHRARLNAVVEWFTRPENKGKWLLIIDGLHEPVHWQRIREMLPILGTGPVLITSRLRQWPDAKAFAIGAWGGEQARGYLLAKTMPGKPHSRVDLAAAERLIDAVGRLPLGVEVLSKFLTDVGKTPQQFVTEYSATLERLQGGVSSPAFGFREIVQRSVESLDAGCRGFLVQLACLAPQPAMIPIAVFEQRGDWPQIRSSIATLEKRGLLIRCEHGRAVSVHRGIREAILRKLPAMEYAAALNSAAANLEAALRRENAQGGAVREALIPHCRVVLRQLEGTANESHACNLAETYGNWLLDAGRPAEAEPYFRLALRIEEHRTGVHQAEVGARLRDLANVMRLRGKARDAENLSRRALSISERIHGLSHSEVVGDLYQVAGALRAANRLNEAEPLLRRALQVEESTTGRSHPRVAIALHRLAGLLEIAHHAIEAEACYRRAIAIDEQAFGQNHPRVIAGLYNLASVLIAERRWDQAASFLDRALAHDERTYGPNHPELAPGLKMQVSLLAQREAWSDAHAVLERVLMIDEQALGPAHVEVAADCLALASVLLEEWRPEDARPFVERGVSILATLGKALRRPHPHLPAALQLHDEVVRAAGLAEDQIAANRVRLLGGIRPPRVHARI